MGFSERIDMTLKWTDRAPLSCEPRPARGKRSRRKRRHERDILIVEITQHYTNVLTPKFGATLPRSDSLETSETRKESTKIS